MADDSKTPKGKPTEGSPSGGSEDLKPKKKAPTEKAGGAKKASPARKTAEGKKVRTAPKMAAATTKEESAPRPSAAGGKESPPAPTSPEQQPDCFITDQDVYLFNEGTHRKIYEKLGAHPATVDGTAGTYFAVWAPSAGGVWVVGDFNGWDRGANRLNPRGSSGIWEGFIAGVGVGTLYKFFIVSGYNGHRVEKSDPFGFSHEIPPKFASVVWNLEYGWNDSKWMESRGTKQSLSAPMSIYEVHVGSWRRHPNGDSLSYREMAPRLAEHVKEAGFTHVELLPIMEHPFYGSWGYQTTGYFAPSRRFGTPEDLMYMIDHLHQEGIGVILDWVPSHFPTDEHGLAYFDGTHLFEHADPRQGFHPDWSSLIFNYGRSEVRSFLTSSAFFWLDKYHVDGIRVDAVASMLYLDYSRKEGEWIPNKYGGRDNLEAIDFLRRLNQDIYEAFPSVQTLAEESTAWPMVSKPTYIGGLGFGFKWDMGWMHDTLKYFQNDPIHRKYHQNQLTFRAIYAFTENFVLPLSHDEVVHGKGSLIGKMPGDDWQKFANLRLLYSYMFAQPGKKLLFMGAEIAQWSEWAHDSQLDWELLDHPAHRGVLRALSDLNRIYRERPEMHEKDAFPDGMEWIDASDYEHSVLTFMRKASDPNKFVIAAFNFTPVPRQNYRIGVPAGGRWREIFNSDATEYGGSGQGNLGSLEASPTQQHGRSHSLSLVIPPLGAVFLVNEDS